MKPIFRWAGSKKKLIPELKYYIPKRYERYYEPFCGSACFYFDFMPPSAVLSDLNPELIHSYKTIQSSPEKIFTYLSGFDVSKETYNRLREIEPSSVSDEMRAAIFIYLNRFCFNGVYRTNQSGKFNVPMGTRTGKLPDLNALKLYSNAIKNVSFMCDDFSKVLEDAKGNDFIYLDPPYSKEGTRNRGEYGPRSFNYLDIERLLELLLKLDSKGSTFLLSYCHSEHLISLLPKAWRIRKLMVNRNVAGFSKHRNHVEEILVSNRSTTIENKGASV